MVLEMEEIETALLELELMKFKIMENYVKGILTKKEIDEFRTRLFTFKDALYVIPISDSNLLKVAKMKSKIQHFETEVLEDEEVLRCAYANSY